MYRALEIRVEETRTRIWISRFWLNKRSRGLPLDLAGLLPGMLRARIGVALRFHLAVSQPPFRDPCLPRLDRRCVCCFPCLVVPGYTGTSGTIIIVVSDLSSWRIRLFLALSPNRIWSKCIALCRKMETVIGM